MMFAITEEEVKALFEKELESANKVNAQFSSSHEAYAVVLEEIEEARECFHNIQTLIEDFWHGTKTNNFDEKIMATDRLETNTIALIREAVQIGAMCEKLFGFLKE